MTSKHRGLVASTAEKSLIGYCRHFKYGRLMLSPMCSAPRFAQDVISPSGCGYMVLVAENKPKEVTKILEQQGFECSIVLRRKERNEDLMILKFANGSKGKK